MPPGRFSCAHALHSQCGRYIAGRHVVAQHIHAFVVLCQFEDAFVVMVLMPVRYEEYYRGVRILFQYAVQRVRGVTFIVKYKDYIRGGYSKAAVTQISYTIHDVIWLMLYLNSQSIVGQMHTLRERKRCQPVQAYAVAHVDEV